MTTPITPAAREAAEPVEQIVALANAIGPISTFHDRCRLIRDSALLADRDAEIERLRRERDDWKFQFDTQTQYAIEFQSERDSLRQQLASQSTELAQAREEVEKIEAVCKSFHFDCDDLPLLIKSIIQGNINATAQLSEAKQEVEKLKTDLLYRMKHHGNLRLAICTATKQEYVSDDTAIQGVRELIAKLTAAESERDAAKLGHDRYEYLRRLTPSAFTFLWKSNISGDAQFDELVDAARSTQRVNG